MQAEKSCFELLISNNYKEHNMRKMISYDTKIAREFPTLSIQN